MTLHGTLVGNIQMISETRESSTEPVTPVPCPQVLLFHDQSYGFHYEYTVLLNTSQDRSNEEHREQEYLYIWTHSRWQDCTVQCGGGSTHTDTHPINMYDITWCH